MKPKEKNKEAKLKLNKDNTKKLFDDHDNKLIFLQKEYRMYGQIHTF